MISRRHAPNNRDFHAYPDDKILQLNSKLAQKYFHQAYDETLVPRHIPPASRATLIPQQSVLPREHNTKSLRTAICPYTVNLTWSSRVKSQPASRARKSINYTYNPAPIVSIAERGDHQVRPDAHLPIHRSGPGGAHQAAPRLRPADGLVLVRQVSEIKRRKKENNNHVVRLCICRLISRCTTRAGHTCRGVRGAPTARETTASTLGTVSPVQLSALMWERKLTRRGL